MRKKYCLLTNDVETTSIWYNSLRDETGLKVWKEGMPILLDIYQKYGVKSTFFYTGYIANLYPDVVKMILKYGHEVGSHALSHKDKDGFDVLNYNQQVYHLSESKKILEDICGKEIISFRAPALKVNSYTPKALLATGFKIDSSIASTRFDAFFSYGSKKKIRWLFTSRIPYKTRIDSLFKKGKDGVIEVPLSATLFPYIGTTMRIFPIITQFQHNLLHFETTKLNSKPIVFDIHPNEFINESLEPRIISKRSINIIPFLLKDLLRSRLKVKNLGVEAIPLYEKEINFFLNRDYSFLTIKDYCTKQNLI